MRKVSYIDKKLETKGEDNKDSLIKYDYQYYQKTTLSYFLIFIEFGCEGGRDRNVLNRLEINSHIRTARQLYIPGSSIKGALKTAFFQHYLNDK